jgi:hypothetical protein
MIACNNHLFRLIPSTNRDLVGNDAPPNSLMDSTANPKVKTTKEKGVGARSLTYSTLGVEGCVGTPKWGLGRVTSKLITHTNLHQLNNKLVSA